MLTLVRTQFLTDGYNAERIFVQTYLKLFIFMSEDIATDGVRDIYHRLYFDPPLQKGVMLKNSYIWRSREVITESNHLGIKVWLTSGCKCVQHRHLSDITCRIVVFHQSRIYGCFFTTRPVMCNMFQIITIKIR